MKKTLVFLIMLVGFFSLAEAKYVRKLREPNFFIPEQDKMHKPEKLPEIKIIRNEKKVAVNKKLLKLPEYKILYSKYFNNITQMKKTKELPQNKELMQDLALMKDGKIFEVKGNLPQEITTNEQRDFYVLAKKILDN